MRIALFIIFVLLLFQALASGQTFFSACHDPDTQKALNRFKGRLVHVLEAESKTWRRTIFKGVAEVEGGEDEYIINLNPQVEGTIKAIGLDQRRIPERPESGRDLTDEEKVKLEAKIQINSKRKDEIVLDRSIAADFNRDGYIDFAYTYYPKETNLSATNSDKSFQTFGVALGQPRHGLKFLEEKYQEEWIVLSLEVVEYQRNKPPLIYLLKNIPQLEPFEKPELFEVSKKGLIKRKIYS